MASMRVMRPHLCHAGQERTTSSQNCSTASPPTPPGLHALCSCIWWRDEGVKIFVKMGGGRVRKLRMRELMVREKGCVSKRWDGQGLSGRMRTRGQVYGGGSYIRTTCTGQFIYSHLLLELKHCNPLCTNRKKILSKIRCICVNILTDCFSHHQDETDG